MTACSAGTANPNSGSSLSTACVVCNADEISTGGSSACIKCPAGSSCSSLTTSTPCAAQTYSLAGETTCTPCPAGSICPTQNQAPQVSTCSLKPLIKYREREGDYCYALFYIPFLSQFFTPFLHPILPSIHFPNFLSISLTIPFQTNHCQNNKPTL